jgi:hypothetical protein
MDGIMWSSHTLDREEDLKWRRVEGNAAVAYYGGVTPQKQR